MKICGTTLVEQEMWNNHLVAPFSEDERTEAARPKSKHRKPDLYFSLQDDLADQKRLWAQGKARMITD